MFASRTGWPLAPNRFSSAVERHRGAGREVLDLTESNPTRCGVTYDPSVLSSLQNPAGLTYDPHPTGLRAAREAVCDYYRERGAQVDPEQVVLTASTSEAYSFLFRLLCNPEDEVLAPAPSYPLFDFLAAIQDVKLLSYSLLYDHGWQIDLRTIADQLTRRTRAILLVHPNNPTGSFVKAPEIEILQSRCQDRGMALIADEVFLDYAHDGVAQQSFADVAPAFRRPEARAGRPRDSRRDGGATQEALTFTLSGISKICALPQMKLAWIVVSGPPELARDALARLEVIADTYLSVSTPVQLALPELLAHREGIQRQVKARVSANLAELDRQLAQQKLVERLDVEGGWYAVLRIPAMAPDEDVAIDLLTRHSVMVHPGHFYDFPGEGNLVVSLITPGEAFEEGVRRVLTRF